MLAIGNGDGPKNVLVELDDGSKIVVAYRTWKYKFKERKQVAEYATILGFVQFPVSDREVGDQTVRDVTIRTPGTQKVPGGGQLIRITLWPELDGVEVGEGDFVAVDGQVSVREHDGKSYINMNAKKFAVLGSGGVSPTREVENSEARGRVF